MSRKNFSVMNPDPSGLWEPATLTLDTVSSNSGTLSFLVHSTRGRGSVLARGEVWQEKREKPSARTPSGHEMIRLELEPPNKVGDRAFVLLATIVGDELLAGAKDLRRTKPRVPHGKTENDEVWTCESCGVKTMSRGSDNVGWKGVQMHPKDPTHTYYCTKEACRADLDKAIGKAKVNWGYEDTGDAPVVQPKQEEPLPMPFIGSSSRRSR